MHRIFYFLLAGLFAFTLAMAELPKGLTYVYETPPAEDFELPTLNGETMKLSDHLGKVVLVNFWATWCPPCREEMPGIHNVWIQLQDKGFEVLAVNLGEDAEDVERFVFEYGLENSFPFLLDTESMAMQSLGVKGLPTTFIVDKQGNKYYEALGPRQFDSEEIVGLIQELLEK